MGKELFDLNTIEKITGGKPDRIIGYIDLYIELADQEVQSLILFLKEENWEELERTAHKMKAGAAYMGIIGLKELAGSIEALAGAKHPDKILLRNQIDVASQIYIEAKSGLLKRKNELK